MKKQWFFWPVGCLLRHLGGIPVNRGRSSGLSRQLAEMFGKRSAMTLAVTPEGTRSSTSKWKTGFLRIAAEAQVPVLLGVIDFKHRLVSVTEEFHPTGDLETDMGKVKSFYAPKAALARYPEKFKV